MSKLVSKLMSKLVNCSIKSVSRICNSAAHELAQAAKTMGSCTWLGNSPSLVVWSVFSADLFAQYKASLSKKKF
jgi:diacylglycerol kinase